MDTGQDESIVTVSPDRAARLTGLSRRQLTYWAERGIGAPSVQQAIDGRLRHIRLYEFQDLMALMVAAQLRSSGISLQHIRSVVRHLNDNGYERPLTELRFATVGKHIYFQHPDGEWESDLKKDQIILHQVLELAPLRARVWRGIVRSDDERGRSERRRGTLGSKELFAGTRVPVETVVRYVHAGRSDEQIMESFPGLTRDDVALARQRSA